MHHTINNGPTGPEKKFNLRSRKVSEDKYGQLKQRVNAMEEVRYVEIDGRGILLVKFDPCAKEVALQRACDDIFAMMETYAVQAKPRAVAGTKGYRR